MAKGGFPGGMGNMNNMLRQVQKMQKDMEKVQEEIQQNKVEASAGGGAVTVVVTGKKEMVSIDIKPEVIDPEDKEMLQDLIMAAVNEANRKADEMVNKEMSKVTGGLNLPGGLF